MPVYIAMLRGNGRVLRGFLCAVALLSLFSCSPAADPNTLTMIIESSPTNLDPRVGQDAQSERIAGLIFDNLLTRDEHLNAAPGIATSWDIPNPLTYIFHLRSGVKFHDGNPLTSRDVKWSFDSLMQGKVRSAKGATFRFVDRIDTPDDSTVVFHLKEPSSTLLWNLASEAMGIVPFGSGEEVSQSSCWLRAISFCERGIGQGSRARGESGILGRQTTLVASALDGSSGCNYARARVPQRQR